MGSKIYLPCLPKGTCPIVVKMVENGAKIDENKAKYVLPEKRILNKYWP